jgi:hypothetical protein
MAKLFATRGAQYLMNSEFIFNYNDTATDSVTGTLKTFGSVYTDAIIFDCIALPPGVQVVGSDLVTELQGVGPTTYTAKFGISGNDAIYLAATTLLSAVNTRAAGLTTSLLGSNNGQNVRMTIASTPANATAGKWRWTMQWKLDNRAHEATPA